MNTTNEKKLTFYETLFYFLSECEMDTSDNVQITCSYSNTFQLEDLIRDIKAIAHYLYWFEHPILRAIVSKDYKLIQYEDYESPNDIIAVHVVDVSDSKSITEVEEDIMKYRIDLSKPLWYLTIAIDHVSKKITFFLSFSHLLFDADSGFYVLNHILELLGSGKSFPSIETSTADSIVKNLWNCHEDYVDIIKSKPNVLQTLSLIASLLSQSVYQSIFGKSRWKGPISLSTEVIKQLKNKSALTLYPFKTIYMDPLFENDFLNKLLTVARRQNVKLTALIQATVTKSYFETFPQLIKLPIKISGNINARRFYRDPKDHIHLGCHAIGTDLMYCKRVDITDSMFWKLTKKIQCRLYDDKCLDRMFRLSVLLNSANIVITPNSMTKVKDDLCTGKSFDLNFVTSNKGDMTSKIIKSFHWQNILFESQEVMSFYGNGFPFISVTSFHKKLFIQLVYRNYYFSDSDSIQFITNIRKNLEYLLIRP